MMIELQDLALVEGVVDTQIVMVLIKRWHSKQIIVEVIIFVKVGKVKLIWFVINWIVNFQIEMDHLETILVDGMYFIFVSCYYFLNQLIYLGMLTFNRSFPERNHSRGSHGNFRNLAWSLKESNTGWYSVFVSSHF